MIIKSMSRKSPSFSQLVAYFNKEHYDNAPSFTQNLWASAYDTKAVEQEFDHNATFLPKRANGNFLYHEVIALEKDQSVGAEKQAQILLDLAQQYARRRAPNQLVYGKMHKETDHLHFHLLISANGINGKSRYSLSRSQFAKIQRDVEQYKIEHYPELGQEKYYDVPARMQRQKEAAEKFRQDEAVKIANREFEFKKRSGQKSNKETLRDQLKDIFQTSLSESELDHRLQQAGFKRYQRGQSEGVISLSDGKKYRLKTLGLETALQTEKSRKSIYAEREAELALLRARQNQSRNKSDNEREQ